MPLIFTPDDLDAQARLRDAFDPIGSRQPATRCCPRGSRCGELPAGPGGRVGLTDGRSLDARSPSCRAVVRRPTRSCPSVARTHWEVGGPPPDGVRGARARRHRRRTTPPTSPSPSAPARPVARARRGARRPRARSARSIRAIRRATVGGVLAVGLSGPPPAPLRAAPRPGARGALRHRRRARREGRRPDGEERERLRHPAPARRVVRHPRRARPGDAALPARARRTSEWCTTDADPARGARARCSARRACSGTARTTHVLARGRTPTTSTAERARGGAGARRDAPPRGPTGPHRGRISVRPRRVDALGAALDRRRRALAGRGRRRHRARRRATTAARLAAGPGRRGRRRLAAARGGRARPRRLRRSAARTSRCMARIKDALRPRRASSHPGRLPIPHGRRAPRDRRAATRRCSTSTRTSSSRAWRAGCASRTARRTGSPGSRSRRPAAASPRCARSSSTARRSTTRSRRTMETCVQCRGCEAACPSAVPFGHLMEGTREPRCTSTRAAPRPRAAPGRRVGRLPRRAAAPPAAARAHLAARSSRSGCTSCRAASGCRGCRRRSLRDAARAPGRRPATRTCSPGA